MAELTMSQQFNLAAFKQEIAKASKDQAIELYQKALSTRYSQANLLKQIAKEEIEETTEFTIDKEKFNLTWEQQFYIQSQMSLSQERCVTDIIEMTANIYEQILTERAEVIAKMKSKFDGCYCAS